MGHVDLGQHVEIHPSARVEVTEYLEIGSHSTIGPNCVIQGRDVRIGQEFWMDEGAMIGGGSCFDRLSSFRAGHFLHMGRDSFVNTARPVTIGDEVGLGQGTKLYTHGAYLSALDGFPFAFGAISIGNNVWLPGAIVNPGVTIGNNVVVGVDALVTRNLPSGCLAVGSPARVVADRAYPRPLMGESLHEFWMRFLDDYPEVDPDIRVGSDYMRIGETRFHFTDHIITGPADEATEQLRNQLRRYGIRFYSRPVEGEYQTWR